MTSVCRTVSYLLIMCLLATLGPNVSAAQTTPTTPKPNSNLDSLRSQLRQTLSGMRNGEEGEEGTSGKKSARGLGSKSRFGNKDGDKAEGDEKAADDPATKGADKGAPAEGAEGGAPPPARAGDGKRQPSSVKGTISTGKGGAMRTGGGAGGGGGATGGGGGGAAVRTVGQGAYEPIKDKKLEYGDVPDEGEPLKLNGPMDVGEFLDTIHFATDWNILVTEAAKKVSLEFWIVDTPPKKAIEILKFHDIFYRWEPEGKYLYVMTKDEFLEDEFGKLIEREFVAEHAAVDYIESVLTPLLSPKGRILTDPRTHHLFVWDTKDNLAKMEETVKELDVPLSEAEFAVLHADVADIEAVLTSLMSPSGTSITDPRTGHILVKDLPENLEQMREVVTKLDVPLESKLFKVTYVNADTLVESVESLLTERGTVQVDPRTNALIVTDMPSRQQQIGEIIATLDQRLETRTWTLKYLEPEDVADRIESMVPEEMGDIISDEYVHTLTVTAIPERIQEIDKLIQAWDIKRRQVQIEAWLVEMNSKLARNLNISWSYFDTTGNAPQAYRIGGGAAPEYPKLDDETIAIGQLPYAEPLRNMFTGDVIKDIKGKEIIKEFHGNRVAAVLTYLDTHGEASVLSKPLVTVQDGEEAAFQNGRQVPYVTSTTYGAGYSGGYNRYNNYNNGTNDGTTNPYNNNYYDYGSSYRPYNRIDFIEVGTILRVLPRISEDESILLDIVAEDSDATLTTVISSGEENTIPEKTESVAETQVRVKNGQTVVIGGLRKNNSSNDVSKSLPVLSDIPVLGRLFKNPSRKISSATLMIFITTTIVDENTNPETERLADFDERFADDLRSAKKTSFGRFMDTISRGQSDMSVSIGQSGHMHYDGDPVTIDDLRRVFQSVKNPDVAKVIIRRHPRAPEAVVTEVTEAALQANLKVDFDKASTAYVPDYENMTGGGDEPIPAAAMPTPKISPKKPVVPEPITKAPMAVPAEPEPAAQPLAPVPTDAAPVVEPVKEEPKTEPAPVVEPAKEEPKAEAAPEADPEAKAALEPVTEPAADAAPVVQAADAEPAKEAPKPEEPPVKEKKKSKRKSGSKS